MVIGAALAMGDAGRQLVVPGLSGPHLGGLQHHRLAQALGELEEQLVHRDRAGQPLTERAQRLVGGDPLAVDETVGAFGQPAPSGQVEQRGESGGDHRQQQQRAFVIRRGAAEAEDDDDVDGDDERRQPGEGDGVGEQAIDPGDHPRQRPAGEADGDEPGEGEGDGAGDRRASR